MEFCVFQLVRYIRAFSKCQDLLTEGSCLHVNCFQKELVSTLKKFCVRHHDFVDSCEGESISNQPDLFPVETHFFFFDVIAF